MTSVREEVDRLRNAGVEIIIALGHAGFRVDKLVGKIPGVDIVVGGHTNTFLYTGRSHAAQQQQQQRFFAVQVRELYGWWCLCFRAVALRWVLSIDIFAL